MKHAVKAVGFDFDHTLGIDNKLERVAFLRLLQARSNLNEEIERIDALLAQQRGGAFSIEEAVRRFVIERGVPESQAGRYADRYKAMCVAMVESFVIAEPGVPELCTALTQRGIPHAILTNGWSPLQQQKARHARFSGDVVVSADIGVQKPSRQAFEALAQTLGVEVHELAYVGDTAASDIAGALACGAFAVWYDAERISYPADLPPPSARIRDLAELPGLL